MARPRRPRPPPEPDGFPSTIVTSSTDADLAIYHHRALGITRESMRMDSQAKYAAVASGAAEMYLRLPTRADYVERIWDHAAGALIVTEAGGRVTDIDGAMLDFSRGRGLERNRGVIASNGLFHDQIVAAVAQARPSI